MQKIINNYYVCVCIGKEPKVPEMFEEVISVEGKRAYIGYNAREVCVMRHDNN